jgi:hypothetical protein
MKIGIFGLFDFMKIRPFFSAYNKKAAKILAAFVKNQNAII